jgi:RNA polymerase sigma-70 factor (ECF subfamily)
MNKLLDPDPEALLQQAKKGDTPTLGRLLELYRSYLVLLARVQISKRLQAKIDASDMVQEAFLGAYRDFPQFRGQTEPEFLGWLRQILASLLANQVRHYQGTQRRDIRLERQLALDLDQSSHALGRDLIAVQSSPSHQAMCREQSVILADALARLPADWREVLILRHLEGLTFPEIATRLDLTIDVVKKLWPKALAGLRCVLEGGRS